MSEITQKLDEEEKIQVFSNEVKSEVKEQIDIANAELLKKMSTIIEEKISNVIEKNHELLTARTVHRFLISILVILGISIIMLLFNNSNNIINEYTSKTNTILKFSNITDFKNVTINELNNELNSTLTFKEIFNIMKNYSINNNFSCISMDYINIENNNKKIIGFTSGNNLIVNKR